MVLIVTRRPSTRTSRTMSWRNRLRPSSSSASKPAATLVAYSTASASCFAETASAANSRSRSAARVCAASRSFCRPSIWRPSASSGTCPFAKAPRSRSCSRGIAASRVRSPESSCSAAVRVGDPSCCRCPNSDRSRSGSRNRSATRLLHPVRLHPGRIAARLGRDRPIPIARRTVRAVIVAIPVALGARQPRPATPAAHQTRE